MSLGRLLCVLFVVLIGLTLLGGNDDQENFAADDTKPTELAFDADLAEPKLNPANEPVVRVSVPSVLEAPSTQPILEPSAIARPPLPSAAPTPRPDTKTTRLKSVYVTGSRVNIRAAPSLGENVLGQFVRGTELSVMETRNGWSRVRNLSQTGPAEGWMSARYLSATKPPAQTASPQRTAQRGVAVPSSSEISAARRQIIQRSMNSYSGSCPCPYNRDRANRRCGKRSAWSRPGGYAPICYESDVTRSHLVSFFARLGKQMP